MDGLLHSFNVVQSPSSRRAWIEIHSCHQAHRSNRSPSSRRAWIEIVHDMQVVPATFPSPSSRRAWIEIPQKAALPRCRNTSPSSRRAWIEIFGQTAQTEVGASRPPRGGRG